MRNVARIVAASPAGQPVWNTLAYFMHAGGHGSLPADWDQFLEFLTRNLK